MLVCEVILIKPFAVFIEKIDKKVVDAVFISCGSLGLSPCLDFQILRGSKRQVHYHGSAHRIAFFNGVPVLLLYAGSGAEHDKCQYGDKAFQLS